MDQPIISQSSQPVVVEDTTIQRPTKTNSCKKKLLLSNLLSVCISTAIILGIGYITGLINLPIDNLQSQIPPTTDQESDQNNAQPSDQALDTSLPAQSPNDSIVTDNWLEYDDDYFSFRYPSDWEIETADLLDSFHITLTSPSNNTGLMISANQSAPYGFSGEPTLSFDTQVVTVDIPASFMPVETSPLGLDMIKELQITNPNYANDYLLAGRKVSFVENGRIEGSVRKVFANTTIYTYPEEIVTNPQVKPVETHIAFGTGYPVSNDETADYQEYLEMRPVILKILETLERKTN